MSAAFWNGKNGKRSCCDALSNPGSEIIIFDTETSGLSPTENHIIQISAIKCDIGEEMEFSEKERLNLYINPGYPVEPRIVELTGITNELLAEQPTEKEVWPQIFGFFGGTPCVCGHNVGFDIKFLNELYKRNLGMEPVVKSVDTLEIARELYRREDVGNHKLGNLLEVFGLEEGLTFHNSMDDVIGTMRLLRFFVDEYKSFGSAEKPKKKAKVVKCSPWNPRRRIQVGGKWVPMKRIYVTLDCENRVVWLNTGYRPYAWGEKTPGTIELVDMEDIEKQVLDVYHVKSVEELSGIERVAYN